jgi:hypothetical protein
MTNSSCLVLRIFQISNSFRFLFIFCFFIHAKEKQEELHLNKKKKLFPLTFGGINSKRIMQGIVQIKASKSQQYI